MSTKRDNKPDQPGETAQQSGSATPPDVTAILRARASDHADIITGEDDDSRNPITAPNEQQSITEQRVYEAADLLEKVLDRKKVTGILSRKYGVTRRHARYWIKKVFDLAEVEQGDETLEAKRAAIRSAAQRGVSLALDRQTMALDKDGREHYVAAPDAGGAAACLKILAQIDGVAAPDAGPTINVHLTVDQRKQATSAALQEHFFPGQAQLVEPAIDAHGESVPDEDSKEGKP